MLNNKLEDTVTEGFQHLYEALISNGDLAFPLKDRIEQWELILNDWINDSDLPLLVRRPGKIRGSITVHKSTRNLLVSDNTPAHWVYKKVVWDDACPSIENIKEAFDSYTFPLAIMMKGTEVGHLKKSQIASAEFRLGNNDWKVAHIEPIALPRTKDLTIDHHIEHHRKFLSLTNVYLIKKKYAGLSEVKMFNDIIKGLRP